MNNFKRLGARGALAIAIAALALSGCDSDSSSSGGGGDGKILLNGGLGGLDGGTGGDGGYFEVEKYTGAGDIVTQGGRANTSFKLHTNTAELGDNPLVVDDDLDLSASVLANCGAAAPTATGTPYQVVGQNVIYLSDGDATACEGGETATGLQVNKGATLTLALTDGSSARVGVSDDIVNNGVITSDDASATDRGNINLDSEDYIGKGQVTTAGTASVPNGGDIDIYAAYALLNSGEMDASGADTATGAAGDAGFVYIEGEYYAQNTGTLKSNGGNAEAGDGGDASYTEVYSSSGSVFNSGDSYVNGGDGTTDGGEGGITYFGTDNAGDVVNSGNSYFKGGDASNGDAGDAGYMYVYYVYGGGVRTSGNMIGGGGNSTSTSGNGGWGGGIYVYAYDYYDLDGEHKVAGDIEVSGRMHFPGGNALATGSGDGGAGGEFYVYTEGDSYEGTATTGSTVKILGYGSVNADAGDGDFGGNGNGDAVYVYNQEADLENNGTTLYVSGGNIILNLDISARGGDALADGESASGDGGDGGTVYVETSYPDYGAAQAVDGAKVTIRGNWDISGGQNRDSTSSSDGFGGYTYIYGFDGVEFAGNLLADGGDDIASDGGTDGYGGDAYELYLYGQGPVSINTISAAGGAGEYVGGDGGYMDFYALSFTAARVDLSGGDADDTLAGSTGGDGGEVYAYTPDGGSTGVLLIAGGAGTTAGGDGYGSILY